MTLRLHVEFPCLETMVALQITPELPHQIPSPFLESAARHASYTKFSPSSPSAAPSSYKLDSPPAAGDARLMCSAPYLIAH